MLVSGLVFFTQLFMNTLPIMKFKIPFLIFLIPPIQFLFLPLRQSKFCITDRNRITQIFNEKEFF